MRKLFLILFFPLMTFSSELETCYKVYFWFLPVAESCVLYSKEGKRFILKSWAKTISVGKFVKPVNSWGESRLVNLKPETFSLYQREGSFIRDHIYVFKEKGIEYRIVRYKPDGDRIKEGFYRSTVYLFDPFSASLLIYIDTPNFKETVLQMFYDEKVQNVRYRTVGEERVKVGSMHYDTWKVEIIPEVETKGVLKPKGKWYVWVDKETNIPVMLKIRFTVGSANIYLEKVRGDKRLLKEVRDEQARVL